MKYKLENIYSEKKYKPPKLSFEKKLDLNFLITEEDEISDKLMKLFSEENTEFYSYNYINKNYDISLKKTEKGSWDYFDFKGKTYDIYLLNKKGKEIANFCFIRNTEGWELVHRNILREYRGNKIGSTLLNIVEKSILKYEKKEIIFKIKTRQIPVITFALKNNFKISPSYEKLFNKIIANNKEYIFKTIKHQGTSKNGYIFKKNANIPPQNSSVKDFVKNSITIELTKKLIPIQ